MCLRLRAVHLTLLPLEQDILSQIILVESDNTAMVSYKNKQGGVVSKTLNDEACTLFELMIRRSIRVIHQPRVNNELADFLLCNCLDPMEWCLSKNMDLFAMHSNHQLPFGSVGLTIHWRWLPMPYPNHGQGCHFMAFP